MKKILPSLFIFLLAFAAAAFAADSDLFFAGPSDLKWEVEELQVGQKIPCSFTVRHMGDSTVMAQVKVFLDGNQITSFLIIFDGYDEIASPFDFRVETEGKHHLEFLVATYEETQADDPRNNRFIVSFKVPGPVPKVPVSVPGRKEERPSQPQPIAVPAVNPEPPRPVTVPVTVEPKTQPVSIPVKVEPPPPPAPAKEIVTSVEKKVELSAPPKLELKVIERKIELPVMPKSEPKEVEQKVQWSPAPKPEPKPVMKEIDVSLPPQIVKSKPEKPEKNILETRLKKEIEEQERLKREIEKEILIQKEREAETQKAMISSIEEGRSSAVPVEPIQPVQKFEPPELIAESEPEPLPEPETTEPSLEPLTPPQATKPVIDLFFAGPDAFQQVSGKVGEGETLHWNLAVSSFGSGEGEIEVVVADGSKQIITQRLRVEGGKTLQIPMQASFTRPGPHRLIAMINTQNNVIDQDVSNNIMEKTIQVDNQEITKHQIPITK